jgi:7-carboxy-7-deazaguanine synthase
MGHNTETNLMVHSIVRTVSGETGAINQGSPVTLLRLNGCNLRCDYCDAKETWIKENRKQYSVDETAEIINKNGFSVLVTGGEPLLQIDALNNLFPLLKVPFIQIETNGTLPLSKIRKSSGAYISIVMDYKLENPPLEENMKYNFCKNDRLKFVVSNNRELIHTFLIINNMDNEVQKAISSTDISLYKEISDTIIYTHKDIIVNVQLHKLIGLE